MTYQSLAFFTGLFGSLHCVMMCGPLVMSLPSARSTWFSLFQKLLYQGGRILTYSLFGLIAGTFGSLFNILGLQQILSVLTGVILLMIALSYFTGSFKKFTTIQARFLAPLIKPLSRWMSYPGGSVFAGMLHGLIPCGMVYMAVAGSLNTSTAWHGASFMFFFGLGTTPLLFLTSLMPVFFRNLKVSRMLIPLLFLISGSVLVIRGLNLNIPQFHDPIRVNEVGVC